MTGGISFLVQFVAFSRLLVCPCVLGDTVTSGVGADFVSSSMIPGVLTPWSGSSLVVVGLAVEFTPQFCSGHWPRLEGTGATGQAELYI